MSLVTRTRVLNKTILFVQRKDGAGSWVTTYTGQDVNYQSITSERPAGKFREGSFKLTDVLLNVVDNVHGLVDSGFYSGYPPYWVGFRTNAIGQQIQNPADPSPVWNSILDQRLIRNAAIKSRQDDVGLSETLRECSQTLQMMKKPFSEMRELLWKTLRNKSGRRRPVKAATSAWLEYRYGWFPLYKTLQSLWEFEPLTKPLANKGYKEYYNATTGTERLVIPFSNPSCSLICSVLAEVRVTFTGRYYFHILEQDLYNSVRLGKSFFNFPAYLWEAVPLSFVIDWFYNVGDLIKVMTPSPYIRTLGATVSKKVETKQTICPRWLSANSKGLGPFSAGGSDTVLLTKTYQRKVVPPVVTLPKLDLGFNSWNHVVDGLSLIFQRL